MTDIEEQRSQRRYSDVMDVMLLWLLCVVMKAIARRCNVMRTVGRLAESGVISDVTSVWVWVRCGAGVAAAGCYGRVGPDRTAGGNKNNKQQQQHGLLLS